MSDLYQTLLDLFNNIGTLLGGLVYLILSCSLFIGWVAWWLWGVNWHKAWPVLSRGAWLPVVLLVFLSAIVWSQIAPSPLFAIVPNFWWQLTAVGLLVASALFLGWFQGFMGWTPPEIAIYPAEDGHGHEHGHGHGDGHSHGHDHGGHH